MTSQEQRKCEEAIINIKNINSKIINLKESISKLEDNVNTNINIDNKGYRSEETKDIKLKLNDISNSLTNRIIKEIRNKMEN